MLICGETILEEAIRRFTQTIKDFLISQGQNQITSIELQMTEPILWFKDNYAYTTLFLVPLVSLAPYVAFLGKGYNYFEHLILNLYVENQK